MAAINELASYALKSLSARSMRSYLTVLGIVVGIAAIVSLISISDGLSKSVNDQLASFGARTVILIPGDISKGGISSASGFSSAGKLYINDMDRVLRVQGVESASGYIMFRSDVKFQDQSITASIGGIEPFDYFSAFNMTLAQGREIESSERGVAIVGAKMADASIFKKPMQVGSTLYFGAQKKPFKVIGVISETGDSDSDNAIFIPIDDARDLAGKQLAKNELSSIIFLVDDEKDLENTIDRVTDSLAAARKVKVEEKDFSFISAVFVKEQMAQLMSILSLFFGFIASISLIVGGIGVANTMYMSVMERTREIGTLKAIGAPDNEVLALFVIESSILGLGGGLIGIVLGVLVALLVNFLGFRTSVSLELAAFAALFSFMLGLVFGYLPARQAAKLDPIDALRYE